MTDCTSLPKVLLAFLAPLPTASLPPLALVSRRFHAIVCRVLHSRLLSVPLLVPPPLPLPPQDQLPRLPSLPGLGYAPRTVTGDGLQLILECYRPSDRGGAPYMICAHEGTSIGPGAGGVKVDDQGELNLSTLHNMYSHFRPRSHPITRWTSGFPPQTAPSPVSSNIDGDSAFPTQDFHLEASSLFNQLICTLSLVRAGPKRGLFLSHSGVSQGVMRVWRSWLEKRSIADAPGERDASSSTSDDNSDREAILWVDTKRNVGIRFHVAVKPLPNDNEVGAGDGEAREGARFSRGEHEDEPEAEWTLQLIKVVVRTNKLLAAAERSLEQERARAGAGTGNPGGNSLAGRRTTMTALMIAATAVVVVGG